MKYLFPTLVVSLYGLVAGGQSLDHRLHSNDKYPAPLISAHRGGFYDSLPENSLSAMEYTYRLSVNPVMVEFDLRKSLEGTLYIMHDETVDRTTNGKGRIAELSDAYLTSLFLKDSEGRLTRDRVPTFEELIKNTKDKNVFLMLDVKADAWKESIQMVKDNDLLDRCIILTFTLADTRKVYELCPKVLISCLVRNETEWEAIEGLSIPNDHLVAYIHDKLSNELITKLKAHGIPLMMDTSEHTRNGGRPLDGESYRSIMAKIKSGIIITDFPVEVSSEVQPH